ncbi:hypothetical protein [Luteolibacter marinus]|uniref:hypothetical protein n=1 Tax=Luteolibacter marinus TaxID=2776705 RepID=UPI0018680801|nr:hypothetical protein [Luteolibacter marinus]
MNKLTLATWLGVGFLLTSCGEKKEPAAAQAPAEEGYVLADNEAVPAPGVIARIESTMTLDEGSMTVSAGGQEMAGTMTRRDSEVKTLEGLPGNKARYLLVEAEATGSMVLNGNERPVPGEPKPLLGLPVMIEQKDGTWTATLESGTATPEQEEELAKIAKRNGSRESLTMYGTDPRKPGDRWQVNPADLSSFGSIEAMEGTMELEFVEVTDFQGTPCAVIKSTFEVTGNTPSDGTGNSMKVTFKGDSLIHRSLADLEDIDAKVNGTMTIHGTVGPQAEMHVEGPMTILETITLTKP